MAPVLQDRITLNTQASNPCTHCTVNMEQAAFEGGVVCYLTCQKWLEWREKIDNQ